MSPGDLTGDRAADLLARDGSGQLWLYPRHRRPAAGPPRVHGQHRVEHRRRDLLTPENSEPGPQRRSTAPCVGCAGSGIRWDRWDQTSAGAADGSGRAVAGRVAFTLGKHRGEAELAARVDLLELDLDLLADA